MLTVGTRSYTPDRYVRCFFVETNYKENPAFAGFSCANH